MIKNRLKRHKIQMAVLKNSNLLFKSHYGGRLGLGNIGTRQNGGEMDAVLELLPCESIGVTSCKRGKWEEDEAARGTTFPVVTAVAANACHAIAILPFFAPLPLHSCDRMDRLYQPMIYKPVQVVNKRQSHLEREIKLELSISINHKELGISCC
jgi:hypothetical protein